MLLDCFKPIKKSTVCKQQQNNENNNNDSRSDRGKQNENYKTNKKCGQSCTKSH